LKNGGVEALEGGDSTRGEEARSRKRNFDIHDGSENASQSQNFGKFDIGIPGCSRLEQDR
jgi:hypothetical protein